MYESDISRHRLFFSDGEAPLRLPSSTNVPHIGQRAANQKGKTKHKAACTEPHQISGAQSPYAKRLFHTL